MFFFFSLCQSGETETITHRLEEAEKALALKQAHIDKLKEEVEQQRTLQETIEVLTAQVSRQKKGNSYNSLLHKFFGTYNVFFSLTESIFLFFWFVEKNAACADFKCIKSLNVCG